jgi:hypothetical protein
VDYDWYFVFADQEGKSLRMQEPGARLAFAVFGSSNLLGERKRPFDKVELVLLLFSMEMIALC